MYNEQRIETIRKNVQNSSLLTDKEKGDWLNLLELMNDKQLGELEEILAAEPAPSPAQQAPANINQKLPPLTHLANIPSDVNARRVSEIKSPTVPPKPQQTPQVGQPLQNQKLPISPPAPRMPIPPPRPPMRPPVIPTAVPAPSPAKIPPPAMPKLKYQPEPVQPPPQPEPQVPYTIEKPEDLSLLSEDSLRIHPAQSILDTVHQAISEHGYFPVLQLIEASPLYAAYINAGHERLGGQPQSNSGQSLLTQAEFEFMTDLLSNMRFNRW